MRALTQGQKLHIAKYAAIHGTAAAAKKEMPEVTLKERTSSVQKQKLRAYVARWYVCTITIKLAGPVLSCKKRTAPVRCLLNTARYPLKTCIIDT